MPRLILLLALVLAAIYLLEAVIGRARRELGGSADRGPADRGRMRDPGPEAGFRSGDRPAAPGEELVACAACGVHTPRSRACWLRRIGPFCSETCRQRAKNAS